MSVRLLAQVHAIALSQVRSALCESGTRVIVADAVHDKFVERLIERASTIRVGDLLEEATDFGPVISAEAQMRILRYIDSGQAEGATLAYGGGRPARGSSAVSGSSRRSSPTSATT